MLGTFTVTSGTPQLLFAEDAVFRNADQGRGLNLYIYSGGGSAQSRTVVSMAAFVQGTGSIFYPHLNFSPAPSTNASIELWQGVDAAGVNAKIDDAIRRAAKRVLDHKEDYSIQLGDVLRHWGSFERWPAGTASVPDGWNEDSGAGTVARESVIKYSGRYSLAQTNTDANAYVLETDEIPEYPKLAGETITARAFLYCTTGSRVRLNISDGDTVTNGTTNDGASGWQEITCEHVVSDSPNELRVQLDILTGGVVTAYWGKVWLSTGLGIYDFELPADIAPATADETAFAYISEAWAESQTEAGAFSVRIPNEYWSIDGDSSTRRIIFQKGLIDGFVQDGRQVKLVGQRHARLPSADTDNLEVEPEFVRRYASYLIMDEMPWDDMDRSRRDRLARDAEELLEEITRYLIQTAWPWKAGDSQWLESG